MVNPTRVRALGSSPPGQEMPSQGREVRFDDQRALKLSSQSHLPERSPHGPEYSIEVRQDRHLGGEASLP